VFPSIEYLEWMWGRPDAATHDLGSSDLHGNRDTDDPIPERLRDRSAPPEKGTLEEQLAAVYDVTPESILVTAGASTANALAIAAAVERAGPDPRALVERPGYEPLVATPEGFGASVDRFPRPGAEDYPLDADRVDANLTATTGLVVATNRHNPTGRYVTRDALSETAAVVADRDAILLVDEVYSPFVLEADRHDGPFGGVSAAGLANTVVTGSLTKFWGLGGLRVGWVVADPDFVDDVRRISAHFPALAEPSRRLGRRAIAHRDELATESRRILERNSERLRSFVAERDDVRGTIFEGASFGFLSHDRADGNRVSEAAWEAGVLVVPGRFFGDESGIRISLGGDPATMADGLAAFGAVLDDL
jgi:aspartate/methionine/tyrosine aminotransferase